jgi:hypothetical protein
LTSPFIDQAITRFDVALSAIAILCELRLRTAMVTRAKRLGLLVCLSLALVRVVSFCQDRKDPKAASQPDKFTIQSNVDVVVVPVVVKNFQGAAVVGLTEHDFQLFDDKKRQVISGFMVATNAKDSSTNATGGVGHPQSRISLHRFVVFLVDDLHITFADLAASREAAKESFRHWVKAKWRQSFRSRVSSTADLQQTTQFY